MRKMRSSTQPRLCSACWSLTQQGQRFL